MQSFDIDFLARGFHLDKNGSVKIKIDNETEVARICTLYPYGNRSGRYVIRARGVGLW